MDYKTSKYSEKYMKFVSSAFFRSFFVRLGSLIYIGFLGRALTLDEMAIVVFVVISSAAIELSSNFGLTYSMQQKAIYYGGEKGMKIIKSCFLTVMLVGCLYSIAMTLFFLIFIIDIGGIQLSLEGQIEFLAINLFAVIFRTVISVEVGLMKVDKAVYLQAFYAGLTYFFVIVFYTIRSVIESILLGMAIPPILLVIIEFKTIKSIMKYETIPKKELIDLIKFGLPFFISVLIAIGATYVDRWLIFANLGSDDLAVYHLMRRLAEVGLEITLALTTGLFPIYTALFADSEERLSRGYSHISRIVLTVALPLFLVFFFFAKTIIVFILGEKYGVGEHVLMTLMIANIFYLIGFMTIWVKNAKGERIEYLVYWILFLSFNAFFGLLLLPYGSQGIAFAYFIACVTCCIYSIIVTVETRKLPLKWIFRFLLFISFTLLVIFSAVTFFSLWLSLIIVFLAIFFLPAIFGLISIHEFAVIKGVLPLKLEKLVIFYERISKIGMFQPINDLTPEIDCK